MAKKKINSGAVVLLIILAVAVSYFTGVATFSTTGPFTQPSFVPDDYGEFFFGKSPLSFAGEPGDWRDDQGKFIIESQERPFVLNGEEGPIILKEQRIKENRFITINTELPGKDIKAVIEIDDVTSPRICNTQNHQRQGLIVSIGDSCSREISSASGLQEIEWLTSSIDNDFGALLVNGINVCERTVTSSDRIKIKIITALGTSCTQSNAEIIAPETKIHAVGQRLPFNCRIDFGKETFVIDREMQEGVKVNLDTFTARPLSFCPDIPVIVVDSDVGGAEGQTEQFLKWGAGETLTIPRNQIWRVSYAADCENNDAIKCCKEFDRFDVEQGVCESEARITVAIENEDGTIETITTTEDKEKFETAATQIPEQAITVDEIEKSTFKFRFMPTFIVIIVVLLLITWWFKRKR